jgi:hypothetical protein
MKSTFLKIEQMSLAIEPKIPHISLFIPLDGDESIHFTNLYRKSNMLLTKDDKNTIDKLNINWKKYTSKGFKSLAVYITHRGHIEVGLPFNMGAEYIIGDTFHVKPLLLLEDYQKRSLLLHFNTKGATLFRVSSKGYKKIESYIPMPSSSTCMWTEIISGEKLRSFLRYLKMEIQDSMTGDIVSVKITGLNEERLAVQGFWKFDNLKTTYCFDEFNNDHPKYSIDQVQIALKEMIDSEYEKHINHFLEDNLEVELSFDFFKLSHLVQNKMIKKLYVSLEDIFFGSICVITGDTQMNTQQLNTHDKDLLNSLLILCLEKNIDVKVIPKKFFPEGLSFIYN